MFKQLRNTGLGIAAAAVFATGTVPRPAAANTTQTLTTIAGAAAVIGGIILYNNYQHKRQAANQVVGYTRNGGSIFGDGRIVMPNGRTIYPSSNGQYPGGQYAYYNPNFHNVVAYDTQRTGQWDTTHRHDNGLHRGWYKHEAAPVQAYVVHPHVDRERSERRDKHEDKHEGEHGHGHDRD
jgi:hypothetical protein